MEESGQKGPGPLGLGDPNDRTLSDVEREIYVPQIIYRMAKSHCDEEEHRRDRCMVKYGIAGLMICRDERKRMNKCLRDWSQHPRIVQEATDKFLWARSEYRSKGEPPKLFRNQGDAKESEGVVGAMKNAINKV